MDQPSISRKRAANKAFLGNGAGFPALVLGEALIWLRSSGSRRPKCSGFGLQRFWFCYKPASWEFPRDRLRKAGSREWGVGNTVVRALPPLRLNDKIQVTIRPRSGTHAPAPSLIPSGAPVTLVAAPLTPDLCSLFSDLCSLPSDLCPQSTRTVRNSVQKHVKTCAKVRIWDR